MTKKHIAPLVGSKYLDITYFPSQIEFFLEEIPGVQYKLAPKGRRAGFTKGGCNFAVELLLDQKKVLWGDTINSNLKRYYERYIYPLMRRINPKLWRYSPQHHQLTYKDGYIDFRSAERPENWEGFGYEYIILNEAGIILKGMKGRNLWNQTITPMILDYKAKVFFVGTPKGKYPKQDEKAAGYTTSLYYELCQRGLNKEYPEWWTKTYPTSSNPLLDKSQIKQIAKGIPAEIRDQEIKGKFIEISGVGPFRRKWFDRAIVDILPPLSEWRSLVISADTAFKVEEENDNTAAIVGMVATNGYYILGMLNKKLDFIDLADEINSFFEHHTYRWGRKITEVLIEDKASGQSLIQVFKKRTKIPVKAIKVKENKYLRAQATSLLWEQGNVYMLRGGWNQELIDQHIDFNILLESPDDIVDATSQFINYFENKNQKPIKYSDYW